jgi:hypothetical protein
LHESDGGGGEREDLSQARDGELGGLRRSAMRTRRGHGVARGERTISLREPGIFCS